MTTDPVSDMLTRIRNSLSRRQDTVELPFSKTKIDILKVLKDKGLILEYNVVDIDKTKKNIVVSLKYVYGKPAITELKRVSKPGRRVYAGYQEIPVVKNNYGFMIISTSKGIKDTNTARKEKIGGELMCEIF